ncbi:hypothetical protein AX16_008143 [Volvariella volvacea WC 439]|nr:hypothetical protein AX16_008143 [Volvariella volvacea WC 439]
MDSHKEPPTPPSPPDPDSSVSDTKGSRKRERELSAEPTIPAKAPVDINLPDNDTKESQAPAKKNRTHLAATMEEDAVPLTRSNSRSPPLSVSPPQEMKIQVRQISQGVEDISWRNKEGNNDQDTPLVTSNAPSAESEDASGLPNTTSQAEPLVHHQPSGTQDQTNNSSSNPPSRRGSESDGGEKGLKRKFTERETSQNPQENGHVEKMSLEALKRPRDNVDEDDNPRETKRPTPPPDSEKLDKTEKPDNEPKFGGFMAYASATSPFGAVRGQNIFAPRKSPSPFSSFNSQTNSFSALATVSSEPSTSAGIKRTGFEAFASSSPLAVSPAPAPPRAKSPALSSPGKLNRNKSPSRRSTATANAFSAYTSTGTQSFALPAQKRQRAESPSSTPNRSLGRRGSTSFVSSNEDEDSDRPATFGERLRAGKDEEAEEDINEGDATKVALTEQDVATGEEEEETIHQIRGKLYALVDGSQWRERGSGLLKLNVKQADGSGARLVMRKDAVFTVLLNVTLFHGMSCSLAQDPRYLRFSTIEDGHTTHYNLRVSIGEVFHISGAY